MAFCEKCGEKLKEEAKFCSGCGTSINEIQGAAPTGTGNGNAATNAPPKKSKFKTGCLGLIGIVILLALVGSCLGDTPKDKAASSNTTGQTQEKKAPEYNYTCDVEGVGKVKGLHTSKVGVAIAKIQETDVIEDTFTSTRAQGIFRMAYIVATNNQKDAVTIDSNSYTLIDDQGRAYSGSVEGATALQMKQRETFFLKKINPGITTGGWLIFDVPPQAKIKSLRFSGGFTGSTAELPFTVMKE